MRMAHLENTPAGNQKRRIIWGQLVVIVVRRDMERLAHTPRLASMSISMTRGIASGAVPRRMARLAHIRQRASIGMGMEPTNAFGAAQRARVLLARIVRLGGMNDNSCREVCGCG